MRVPARRMLDVPPPAPKHTGFRSELAMFLRSTWGGGRGGENRSESQCKAGAERSWLAACLAKAAASSQAWGIWALTPGVLLVKTGLCFCASVSHLRKTMTVLGGGGEQNNKKIPVTSAPIQGESQIFTETSRIWY